MGSILRVNQMTPARETIDEAVAVLSFAGVVVMPTDSVYGIGCAATEGNPAHRRIFDIKRRPLDQPLPWLVADVEDLDRYSARPSMDALKLAIAFWPGALTLVVEASDEVPSEYRSADGTIALRLPNSSLVREIIRRVGAPLATTSANTHGFSAAVEGSGIEARLVEEADLTLDAGPAPIAMASTIVRCVGHEPVILREEAITRAQIFAAL